MIGAGNMGSSIIRSIRKQMPEASIYLNNRTISKIEPLAEEINARIVEEDNLKDLIDKSDYIYLGVKPHQIPELFEKIKGYLSSDDDKVWISMAVGISLDRLRVHTPDSHKWIRIMPNTPVLCGEGYIGYSLADNITQGIEEEFVSQLLGVGTVQKFDESSLDAVSSLAGSSPAYIYQLIDAMSDAGVYLGLDRDDAIQMSAQVVKGAAQMVLETKDHPGVLKNQVTSPGGTTIEGIVSLEKSAFKAAIIEAIIKAYDKATKM